VFGAAAAVAAPPNGVHQTNSSPDKASVTAGSTTAPDLNLDVSALGDASSVSATTYASADSQADSAPADSSVSVDNLQVSGNAAIQAQAGGNSEEIASPQGGDLQATQSTAATISAQVQIGAKAGAAQSFGGTAQVSSAAFGNLASFDAASGQITAGIGQTNAGQVQSSVTIANTAFDGPLTGATTAAGNEIDLDHSAAAAAGQIGELSTSQANAAAQSASLGLTDVQTNAAANSYAVSAVGNVLNAGDLVVGAAITQTNAGPQTAQALLNQASLNGDFVVQAVGNQVVLANNGAIGLHQQNAANQLAEVVSNAGLVLNGATSIKAVALGNNFEGALAPGQLAGQDQQFNSGFQTASIDLNGASAPGDGPISMTATAIGNAATLSAPDPGFVQANYDGALSPQAATVTLSNSTFSSGVSVSTTAQGNVVIIRH